MSDNPNEDPDLAAVVARLRDTARHAGDHGGNLTLAEIEFYVRGGFAAGHAAASPDPPRRTVHKCPSCNRYFDSPSVCSDGTHTVEQEERVPSGAWPDQSAQHAVLLDEIRELHQENERLRAASPDERLREAVRDFLDGVFEGDGRWDRLHAALAATDRDKPDGTTPTFCCRPDCGLRATRIAPDPDGVRWRPYCSDCSLPASPEPKDRDPKEKP